MPRGGSRPGAGRPRKNAAADAAPAKKRVATRKPPAGLAPDGEKTPEAPASWPFGTTAEVPPEELTKLTPLEFLLKVMRDETEEKGRRIQAASLAAPYCHAKMGEKSAKAREAEARKDAASGRFGRRQPPKLVAAGGKKVE